VPVYSESDLVAALNNGQFMRIYKPSQTTEGAATFHSMWKVAGWPIAGASPPAFSAGSGYVPTAATAGAVPYTNPASPSLAYLAGVIGLKSSVVGSVEIYDRLWACSGFNTTTLTAQAVTTPGALPSGRDPNSGADVEPWVEIYTAPGATGATWTLTGVDAAGNTGRTWTYTHPANAETVGQMAPFVPGTASTPGIRQVTSLTCSVSSGTAGDVGVTLLRRLSSVGLGLANVGVTLDAFGTGLQRIFDDSCLSIMVLCSATTSGNIQGGLLIGKQ